MYTFKHSSRDSVIEILECLDDNIVLFHWQPIYHMSAQQQFLQKFTGNQYAQFKETFSKNAVSSAIQYLLLFLYLAFFPHYWDNCVSFMYMLVNVAYILSICKKSPPLQN